MRILLVCLALGLGGCVMPETTDIFNPEAQIEPFTAPDGKPAFMAHCGGRYSSISYCYEGARKQCGGNYKIVRQVETPRGETGTENRRIEFTCDPPTA